MAICTEIIDENNIDEMFESPADYVDDSYDRPIIKIWEDGDVLCTIMLGMDESGWPYLVFEDDDVSEDYYPAKGESLWDTYERALNEWLATEEK